VSVLSLPCLGLACATDSKYEQPPFSNNYGAIAPPASPVVLPQADDSFRMRLTSEPALAQPQTVSIGLDTVLRFAEEQNPQIAIARAKVCAAFAEKEAAEGRWIPDIYVGVGYWRHEGGIQLQEGRNIHSSTGAFTGGAQLNGSWHPREVAYRQLDAARKIWQ